MREIVARDGSVLKCPDVRIGGRVSRHVSDALWIDFYEAQVARSYDEEDPYTTEVGGE